MIGLDLDGIILNYSGHTEKIEVNYGLLKLLPVPSRPVVIVTNQGGMAFSYRSQELGLSKYPTPEQVAARLRVTRRFLNTAGDTVTVSREDAMQVCRDLDALLFFVQRHKAGFVDSAGNKWRPEAKVSTADTESLFG